MSQRDPATQDIKCPRIRPGVAKSAQVWHDPRKVKSPEHEDFTNYERDPVGIVNQATGVPGNPWDGSNGYRLANGQPYYSNNSNQHYSLNSLFVGDTLQLLDDRLTLQCEVRSRK